MVTDPQTHKQTGAITIRCAAASLACSVTKCICCRMSCMLMRSSAVWFLVRQLRHSCFMRNDALLRHRVINVSSWLPCAAGLPSSQRMWYSSMVVDSPHPELAVLKEDPPPVPHFVLNALQKYSKQTALVSCIKQRYLSLSVLTAIFQVDLG